MATLYSSEVCLDPKKDPDSDKLKDGIVDLFESNKYFRVDGYRVLKNGTPEWNSHFAEWRKRLEGLHWSKQEIDEDLARFADCKAWYNETPFSAIHYFSLRGRGDEIKDIPKRVFLDGKIIADVSVPRKQIDVFPSYDEHCEFIRGHGKKAGFENLYGYDGTFTDALKEFAQKGYRFKLWNMRWNSQHLDEGVPNADVVLEDDEGEQNADAPKLVTDVTLEDVLAFASKK